MTRVLVNCSAPTAERCSCKTTRHDGSIRPRYSCSKVLEGLGASWLKPDNPAPKQAAHCPEPCEGDVLHCSAPTKHPAITANSPADPDPPFAHVRARLRRRPRVAPALCASLGPDCGLRLSMQTYRYCRARGAMRAGITMISNRRSLGTSNIQTQMLPHKLPITGLHFERNLPKSHREMRMDSG